MEHLHLGMETILTIMTIIGAALGAVMAVKLDLAKLRTDMDWVKKNISRIWSKLDGEGGQ